jgi:cobalt-zinc-cadmium efflux system protein
LGYASLITFIIFFVELVGGLLSGSLALLADAGHMASDILSLGLSYLAAWVASRPASAKRSYGYYRVEILAALTNGIILCLVAVFICMEALDRLSLEHPIQAEEMFGFGLIGLLANIASAMLLFKNQSESVNVRAAYVHVLSDLAGSVAVLIGAVIIFTTGKYWVDSLLSFVIAALILKSAWEIIHEVLDVLMETVPSNIDIKEVEADLRQTSHVKDIHDLHVWAITTGINALSCHILVDDYKHSQEVLLGLNKMLKERYNIDHVTIQLEDNHVNNFVLKRHLNSSLSQTEYPKHWYH